MSPRTAIRDAGALIARREPFWAYGSMHGATPPEHAMTHYDLGRLPREHGNALMIDYLSGRLDFIVYSYATPIAWHRTDTGWTIPDVRYSATTSRHQGVVRRAVA